MSDKKLQKVPFKKNKAFCIAPWTHTYISPQSERRLCCASREKHSFIHQYIDQDGESGGEYNPVSLKEHWNGDFLKSIRKQMLEGQVPKECQVCHEQVLNLHTYQNYFNKTMFPDRIKEAYEKTDDTGYTTMEPISFDYRFTNLCDFKCRMCGAQLSSSWESENQKHKKDEGGVELWMEPGIRKKIKSFQKDVVEAEFMEAVDSGRLREIYWVGGEPLIWPIHWKSMAQLIEQGDAKDIFVRYNSNLGTIERAGTRLFQDILPHFKDFNMCASLDGVGKIGEFIRTGLKWETFKSNFEEGLKICDPKKTDQMVMDLTITLPGLFSLKEYIDQAHQWDVKVYAKIIFDFDPSVVLSPFALPRDIFNEVIDDLISYCENKVNKKTLVIVETLKEMRKRPVFEEKYPDTWKAGFISGRTHQDYLAKIRKDGEGGRLTLESIYQENSKVLNWWKQDLL